MFYYYYGDKDDLLKMIHNLMNPDSMMHAPNKRGNSGMNPPEDGLTCPGCGLSRTELYQNGKIGCSQCVDTFRADLETILQHIQGRYQFSGRVPEALADQVQINVEEIQVKLDAAIADERYEDAAVFRDLLKEAESRRSS